MATFEYDFGGYATKSDVRCSDGRTIKSNAFIDCDNTIVPLCWNHNHDSPDTVLGHALLKNRDDGVYAYCSLNDTETGELARKLIKHKDIRALSIYANQLRHSKNREVVHGMIREVSLVHAGANPEAFIDTILMHSDETKEEGVVFIPSCISCESGTIEYVDSVLEHSDTSEKESEEEIKMSKDNYDAEIEHSDEKSNGTRTVKDIFDTYNEEQKKVFYYLLDEAIKKLTEEENNNSDEAVKKSTEKENNDSKEDNKMSHNIFENDRPEETLSHSEEAAIFADLKRCGSLREAALAHGVEDIEFLFPDAKNVSNTPYVIKDEDSWVRKVMTGVHRSPFSRIKTLFADITGEEARARGYIKGKFKKEEVFKLLKRSTAPTTIYKKQKMHRDDLIDIVDMDFVAFLKAEMRMKLDEEIAKAILISDGRPSGSDDKISEDCVRPIWTDSDLFTIKVPIADSASMTDAQRAKEFIKTVIKSRKDYKGSGNPTLFTTEDLVTECLLLEDGIGHFIYKSVSDLATTLRVKEIVTVPAMNGAKRDTDTTTNVLAGIIVNLNDYHAGADKGGAVNMFEDFDIDYNANKYLIETRMSGALVIPYSALAIEFVGAKTDDGLEDDEP